MVPLSYILACWIVSIAGAYKDYTGHKVISVSPKTESQLELLYKLRDVYSVDLWNEPKIVGIPVMIHLRPDIIKPVEDYFKKENIKYEIAYSDLQRAIDDERTQNAPTNTSHAADMNSNYRFKQYKNYDQIINFLKVFTNNNKNITTLEIIGKSYENRPIYSVNINKNKTVPKKVVIIECGIHAREWTSVAAGVYLVQNLVNDSILNKFEFNIVVLANPDGYAYTWDEDRLWRKTRSRSSIDLIGACRGVDANRNFDVSHCGVGTSRKPCDETYCGERAFSEGEARALRDLIIRKKDRLKVYFSLHAYSQLWMTPYGTSKKIPPNFKNLTRMGMAGIQEIKEKYNTNFKFGTISNVIYEAAGSSVDYAYQKQGVEIAFALELRDTGRYGFILPADQVLPACQETFDGIITALYYYNHLS